ncbi:MAG: DUF2155 domain-containing protein [Pseudomonadota bacterium]
MIRIVAQMLSVGRLALALAMLSVWVPSVGSAQTTDTPTEDDLARQLREALSTDSGLGGEPATSEPGTILTLRALDKISGRSEVLEVTVGESIVYERLRIDVKSCNRRVTASALDASAFIQVFDTKHEPPLKAFSGWMFASSPALSAMDHPRYDVWVLSCKIS